MEINLESLLKIYGPLGLFVGFLMLVIWKALIPRIDKQQEQHVQFIIATLDDARTERDKMRELREREVDKFIQSLKFRDEEFKAVAEAIKERRNR